MILVNHRDDKKPTLPQNRPKQIPIMPIYVRYTTTGKTPTSSNRLLRNQRLYRKRYPPDEAQFQKEDHHQR